MNSPFSSEPNCYRMLVGAHGKTQDLFLQFHHPSSILDLRPKSRAILLTATKGKWYTTLSPIA